MGMKAIWFGMIFAAFGLVFAAIGELLWHFDNKLAGSGERASGVVTGFESSYTSDSGTTYKPRVRYTDAQGTERNFTSSMGSNPRAFDRGEEVEVIYDPASPDRAIIDSFSQRHLFPLVFGGTGLLFAAIGMGIAGWQIRRRRIIAWLKQRGMVVEAEFLECYHDTSMRVNGRSPWRVVAQSVHPATGKLAVYKSDSIWADPSSMLHGQTVRILIDPQKPDRHYVDLEAYLGESALG